MSSELPLFDSTDTTIDFFDRHKGRIEANANLDDNLLSTLWSSKVFSPLEWSDFSSLHVVARNVKFVNFLKLNPERVTKLETINAIISACQNRLHPRPTIAEVFKVWKVFEVSKAQKLASGTQVDWYADLEEGEPIDLSSAQCFDFLKGTFFPSKDSRSQTLKRGSTICFVWSKFNQIGFKNVPNYKLEKPIKKTFQQLTSEPVEFVPDCQSKQDFDEKLNAFKKTVADANAKLDYLVVILSSHGSNKTQFYTSDGCVIDLYRHVIHELDGGNFPGLDPWKPRIYLFDACQSDLTSVVTSTMGNPTKDKKNYVCKSPHFVFTSTIATERAWYGEETGSRFLQAVCNKFEKGKDFFTLVAQVQEDVDRQLRHEPELRQNLGCCPVRMSPVDVCF